MNIVPFDISHLDVIDVHDFENACLRAAIPEMMGRGGYTVSLFSGEVIIALGGFYHIFSKVVEVFVVPSVHARLHPIPLVRESRRFLAKLESQPVHRIQSMAKADDFHDRWMTALGFTCEGTLVKYTNEGVDYRQWARVKQ